jgi:hypothetical protein
MRLRSLHVSRHIVGTEAISRAPVIVLYPNDVVLADIAAGLDLDQLQQDLAGGLQPIIRIPAIRENNRESPQIYEF